MKVLLSWSSGKDSAWALHVLRRAHPSLEVVGLLTTVSSAHDRVAMHGVRRLLLDRQAKAVGLDLWEVEIPARCSNEVYEAATVEALDMAAVRGVEAIAFGDLFLEDVRSYRLALLEKVGLQPLFPVWGLDTTQLAQQMIEAGCCAHLTCIDPRVCPHELAGAAYDAELLAALPPNVDPCGENGEFHTFVSDGPAFAYPIAVQVGKTVERDGFMFTDLLLAP